MRNILGRSPRTPIGHHVDLGITEQEIPRKLLIVCTVSVHYYELQIVREEMQWLVQYKSVESATWEQPFEYDTSLTMRHDDLLEIGKHTFQAKREITTITIEDHYHY
jgi:hypothetical protein